MDSPKTRHLSGELPPFYPAERENRTVRTYSSKNMNFYTLKFQNAFTTINISLPWGIAFIWPIKRQAHNCWARGPRSPSKWAIEAGWEWRFLVCWSRSSKSCSMLFPGCQVKELPQREGEGNSMDVLWSLELQWHPTQQLLVQESMRAMPIDASG